MAVDATRAKSLFLAAVDIPDAAERAAYLGRECGDDAELLTQVEDLLRANAPAPSLTGAYFPATDGSDRYAQPRQNGAIGTVIAGRYNLVEVIGEGGMVRSTELSNPRL